METYYNTILLSGGSIKTLSTLGALQYCYDNNLLDHSVETFVGTSAGAIICYLLVIGYTPVEVICYFVSKNLFRHEHYVDIVSMLKGDGAISFLDIHEHLENLTIEKIGRLVTFKEVRDLFGKTLVMTTYNYTKKQIEYLSPETTPDLPCLIGLRMSTCLPFVFSKYKYKDCFYIDGGVIDNFPLEYIDPSAGRTLGFHIDIFHDLLHTEEESLLHTVYALLSIPLKELERVKLEERKEMEIIFLQNNVHLLNFDLTPKEKLDLFSDGYQIAQTHFSN